MPRRMPLAVFTAVICPSLIVVGCGPSPVAEEKVAEDKAAKEVVVDGSSTVFRISRSAAQGYRKVQPSVSVVVSNHGTGGGFGKYIKGEVDIVDASRPAKLAEEKDAEKAGMLPWTRYLVGYDGITVVVSAKN